MTDPDAERLVGENRCWACTIVNGGIGALVAGIPLIGGMTSGDPGFFALTILWAVGVSGYTLYRLVSRGYLPGSERIAKRTGLHERIGPGAKNGEAKMSTGSGREDHGE